jgi:hypothetical protein
MHSNRFPHPFTDNRTPLGGRVNQGWLVAGLFVAHFWRTKDSVRLRTISRKGCLLHTRAPIFPIRLQGRLAGFIGPKVPQAWLLTGLCPMHMS